jgi:hypothetical protein
LFSTRNMEKQWRNNGETLFWYYVDRYFTIFWQSSVLHNTAFP